MVTIKPKLSRASASQGISVLSRLFIGRIRPLPVMI